MARFVDEYQAVAVGDNPPEREAEDTNPLLDDHSFEKDKNNPGKAGSTDSRSTLYDVELAPDLRHLSRLQTRLRWTRWLAWIEGGLLVVLIAYIAMFYFHKTPAGSYPDSEYGPLGTDWNGFVPHTVGQPLGWYKYDDESDMYAIKMNALDSIENTRAEAARIEANHNTSIAKIVGGTWPHAMYKNLEGEMQVLPEFNFSGNSAYLIKSLHQMHCVSVLIDGLGYPLNGVEPKWQNEHLVHCLNTLRAAVQCLSDSTPISYVKGYLVGHTTDDQQGYCRNFYGLLDWVHGPERRVQVKVKTPPDVPQEYELVDPSELV